MKEFGNIKHTHTISKYLCMVVFALAFMLAGCPPAPTTILTQSVPINKILTLSLDKKITSINDKNKITVYKQSANATTSATKIEQDGFTAKLVDGTLVITLKDAIEERDIAYVSLKADAVTYEDKVGNDALVFMRIVSRSYKFISTVSQAYNYISTYYYKAVNEQDILDGTLQGMMRNLGDPYSAYITQEHAKLYWESLTGTFGGLGIYIKKGDANSDHHIKVTVPIKGSPAYKAGIRSDDVIISIDGKSTKNMSTNDAAKRMRGNPNTTVTLTIKHKGKLLTMTITRKVITAANVQYGTITAKAINDIAYLSIKIFNKHATKGVTTALEALNKLPYKTLIIDLRNNPGGLLSAVLTIANYFLDEGKLIIGTKARTERWNQEYRTRKGTLVGKDKKIVVIINGRTASASEILSGAIRFNGRGILVGEKTYGKGLVQSLIHVQGGGLMKVTTSEYYMAGKRFINKKGISPDIEIKDIPCKLDGVIVTSLNMDDVLRCTVNKIKNGAVDKAIERLPRLEKRLP